MSMVINFLKRHSEYGRDIDLYRPLLDAAMDGAWESAGDFIKSYPGSVEVPITISGRTALHIAAGAGHSEFVLNLIKIMPIKALELRDYYNGNTALHLAVIAGLDEAVKVMVQKHRHLTRICNKKGLNPLLNAAAHVNVEHKHIFRFLSGVMKDEDSSSFQGHLGAHLICSITRAGLYELAYDLIREHPCLATSREEDGRTMLDALAEKGSEITRPPSTGYTSMSYNSGIQQYEVTIHVPKRFHRVLFFLNRRYPGMPPIPPIGELLEDLSIDIPKLLDIIFKEISRMPRKDMHHFFFNSSFPKTAAKTGSIEILKRCISAYPDQLSIPHEGNNIFQIAVENRQEEIFDYLYDHMNGDKKILITRTVDSKGGNILHVAAKTAPPFRLKGSPVQQMQREINWFKKVEKRVPPSLRKMRNDDGETPQEVFTREHKDLAIKAEAYFLRTAESSLIVAALVATVAFAAAITVPGGNFSDSNKDNKGKPIFFERKSLLFFMVLDALALFSSAYSIQVFLSALGMTHLEAAFERIIPLKLKGGLVSLRISVVFVMIAFSIALAIMLGGRYVWAPYLIGVVTCFCSSPSLLSLFRVGFTDDLEIGFSVETAV
ncbi:hypothetical protein MKW92_040262 [Papaver armeniacum]|nr:hypothetical protein MKW92_040262 [Papaver armeniacum]